MLISVDLGLLASHHVNTAINNDGHRIMMGSKISATCADHEIKWTFENKIECEVEKNIN